MCSSTSANHSRSWFSPVSSARSSVRVPSGPRRAPGLAQRGGEQGGDVLGALHATTGVEQAPSGVADEALGGRPGQGQQPLKDP
ncbi:MAG: hypothetical protein JWR81_6399 [Pseudonocardia sp.]|nr:hypothetical protein [Pseudonocardia sp.]MCW2722577.1 hypothetical protein [Pseudonocardia sp.]MDT7614422.1 hypothetical protein [Pseudonocardiales bacterium]